MYICSCKNLSLMMGEIIIKMPDDYWQYAEKRQCRGCHHIFYITKHHPFHEPSFEPENIEIVEVP